MILIISYLRMTFKRFKTAHALWTTGNRREPGAGCSWSFPWVSSCAEIMQHTSRLIWAPKIPAPRKCLQSWLPPEIKYLDPWAWMDRKPF